ncbi:YdcF family protein [Caulobacter sp. LARHSG274]
MRVGLTSALVLATLLLAPPSRADPVVDQQWSVLAARLFPALTALGRGQAADGAKPSSRNAALVERRGRMDACQQAPGCLFRAGLWSDAEIAEVAALADRTLQGPARQAVSADDGLQAQVARELKGLNGVLQVYGLGAPPRYPQIDGPIDPPGTALFAATLADAVSLADGGKQDASAVLDPSLALVLALLDVNDRKTASAFEPLDERYNAGALAHARTVDWRRYRFTAIIVPGVGPENPALTLSARGKLNVRMAAQRFADGAAPFIILSGGAVHPRQSPNVEALEMRRALIERFAVPPESIVVEPYARHTTTNLRNVSRRLFALGAPVDQEALIVTNAEQSKYIESALFSERNRIELGYQPGEIERRLSPVELTFRPAASSLRIDPLDPLDP